MIEIDIYYQLIRSGKLLQALEQLALNVKKQKMSLESQQDVIQLIAEYRGLEDQRIRGLVLDGDFRIQANQIRYRTMQLLEKFGQNHSGKIKMPAEEVKETRILFFSANTDGKAMLNLESEVREIKNSLALASLQKRFDFIIEPAARPNDFMTSIMKYRPEIVHFSGHGTGSGIYMFDENDLPILIPKQVLVNVFSFFSQVVGCLVLNACYSGKQLEGIKKYITHVIGTTDQIEDKSAIQFSSMFYRALGEGNGIEYAFEFARLSVEMSGLSNSQVFMRM